MADRYKVTQVLFQGKVVIHAIQSKQISHVNDIQKIITDVSEIPNEQNGAQIAMSLKHPNIIKIYEVNLEENPLTYTQALIIIMEKADSSLEKELNIQQNSKSSFPLGVILFFLEQISCAVEFCHGQKNPIVHRDLKPDNILIFKGDYEKQDFKKFTLKICDFGTIKKIQTSSLKTQCGTKPYMSPEIIQGLSHGTATDIWSLGCIAYELCTLQKLFVRADADPAPYILKGVDSLRINQIQQGQEIKNLILQMLEFKASNRINAKDLHLKLTQIQNSDRQIEILKQQNQKILDKMYVQEQQLQNNEVHVEQEIYELTQIQEKIQSLEQSLATNEWQQKILKLENQIKLYSLDYKAFKEFKEIAKQFKQTNINVAEIFMNVVNKYDKQLVADQKIQMAAQNLDDQIIHSVVNNVLFHLCQTQCHFNSTDTVIVSNKEQCVIISYKLENADQLLMLEDSYQQYIQKPQKLPNYSNESIQFIAKNIINSITNSVIDFLFQKNKDQFKQILLLKIKINNQKYLPLCSIEMCQNVYHQIDHFMHMYELFDYIKLNTDKNNLEIIQKFQELVNEGIIKECERNGMLYTLIVHIVGIQQSQVQSIIQQLLTALQNLQNSVSDIYDLLYQAIWRAISNEQNGKYINEDLKLCFWNYAINNIPPQDIQQYIVRTITNMQFIKNIEFSEIYAKLYINQEALTTIHCISLVKINQFAKEYFTYEKSLFAYHLKQNYSFCINSDVQMVYHSISRKIDIQNSNIIGWNNARYCIDIDNQHIQMYWGQAGYSKKCFIELGCYGILNRVECKNGYKYNESTAIFNFTKLLQITDMSQYTNMDSIFTTHYFTNNQLSQILSFEGYEYNKCTKIKSAINKFKYDTVMNTIFSVQCWEQKLYDCVDPLFPFYPQIGVNINNGQIINIPLAFIFISLMIYLKKQIVKKLQNTVELYYNFSSILTVPCHARNNHHQFIRNCAKQANFGAFINFVVYPISQMSHISQIKRVAYDALQQGDYLIINAHNSFTQISIIEYSLKCKKYQMHYFHRLVHLIKLLPLYIQNNISRQLLSMHQEYNNNSEQEYVLLNLPVQYLQFISNENVMLMYEQIERNQIELKIDRMIFLDQFCEIQQKLFHISQCSETDIHNFITDTYSPEQKYHIKSDFSILIGEQNVNNDVVSRINIQQFCSSNETICNTFTNDITQAVEKTRIANNANCNIMINLISYHNNAQLDTAIKQIFYNDFIINLKKFGNVWINDDVLNIQMNQNEKILEFENLWMKMYKNASSYLKIRRVNEYTLDLLQIKKLGQEYYDKLLNSNQMLYCDVIQLKLIYVDKTQIVLFQQILNNVNAVNQNFPIDLSIEWQINSITHLNEIQTINITLKTSAFIEIINLNIIDYVLNKISAQYKINKIDALKAKQTEINNNIVSQLEIDKMCITKDLQAQLRDQIISKNIAESRLIVFENLDCYTKSLFEKMIEYQQTYQNRDVDSNLDAPYFAKSEIKISLKNRIIEDAQQKVYNEILKQAIVQANNFGYEADDLQQMSAIFISEIEAFQEFGIKFQQKRKIFKNAVKLSNSELRDAQSIGGLFLQDGKDYVQFNVKQYNNKSEHSSDSDE